MASHGITNFDSTPIAPFGFAVGAIAAAVMVLQVTVFGKLTAPSAIGFVLRVLVISAVVGGVGGYVLAHLYDAVGEAGGA